MRIVIDLQGAQSASSLRGIGRYSLALAEAMIRLGKPNHEFIIALNGILRESIEPIRSRFDGLLDQSNIRVWTAAGPVSSMDSRNTWRRHSAELAREAFLASLEPDVVHISSLFEGFYDNSVETIGLLPRDYCTAVTFYDVIPLLQSGVYLKPVPGFEPLYREKISFLRHADIFFAISESSRREAIEHVDVPPDNVISIAAAADDHFRPQSIEPSIEAALRKRLGLRKKIIMYSGATDERKNHLRLIRAFSKLPIELRANYQLAIVGRTPAAHRNNFEAQAQTCGLSAEDLVITGGVTDVDLHRLYAICELFVFPSWHEGFGLPALEAMSCGAAVIGSNNTSVPEVIGRADALFDPLDEGSISSKMAEVLSDDAFRQSLKQHAIVQAANFSWKKSAGLALGRLEGWYTEHLSQRDRKRNGVTSVDPVDGLVQSIAKLASANVSLDDWASTARAIAQNHPRPSAPKLMLDVSELVERDSRSGIQRVVRAVLAHLLDDPPAGWKVVLVRSIPGEAGLRTASAFTAKFRGLPTEDEDEYVVEACNGDMLLGLDLNHGNIIGHAEYLRSLRNLGVKVYFVIYDLIPVLLPTVYPKSDDLSNLHSRWLDVVQEHDGVVCISRSVADEFVKWLSAFGTRRLRPFNVGYFHLGADMSASVPTRGMDASAAEVRKQLKSRLTFLSVGTIEPRKGHLQTIQAFNLLWAEGLDVNLVLVGKRGWDGSDWSVESAIKVFDSHKDRGRRFFWLDAISDEYLENVYEDSDCYLTTSLAEGFGLPIIEAARHGLPIIARDLPVFREVAGEHAEYFEGLQPESLADAIRRWIANYEQGVVRSSSGITFLSWKQSTQMLLDVILRQQWYRQWRSGNEERFRATDIRFESLVGKRLEREIVSNRDKGFLLHGPYIALEPGNYRVTVRGRVADSSTLDAFVDVAMNKGTIILGKGPVRRPDCLLDASIASIDVVVPDNCTDFEVRLWVERSARVSVSIVEVLPVTKVVGKHSAMLAQN
jgi:glycosyltransferase involved in cell wall biosynthesis